MSDIERKRIADKLEALAVELRNGVRDEVMLAGILYTTLGALYGGEGELANVFDCVSAYASGLFERLTKDQAQP